MNINAIAIRSQGMMFEGVKFNPLSKAGQVWLRAAEIAQALGYSRSDMVTKIYDRNRDEFTSQMTMTMKLKVEGFDGAKKEVRLFSLRGAHLIAMLARTAVAKKFRAWVLDLIDREIERVTTRRALDAVTMEELTWLCNETDVICAWWRKFGGAIETVNPKLHAAVREHFLFAQGRARAVQRGLRLQSSRAYMDGFPWLGTYTDREYYRRTFGSAVQPVGGAA